MSANDSLQENAETVLVDDATATRVFDRAAGDTPSAVTAISAAFAASKLPNDATIVMLSEAEPVSLPITVLATPAQLGLNHLPDRSALPSRPPNQESSCSGSRFLAVSRLSSASSFSSSS